MIYCINHRKSNLYHYMHPQNMSLFANVHQVVEHSMIQMFCLLLCSHLVRNRSLNNHLSQPMKMSRKQAHHMLVPCSLEEDGLPKHTIRIWPVLILLSKNENTAIDQWSKWHENHNTHKDYKPRINIFKPHYFQIFHNFLVLKLLKVLFRLVLIWSQWKHGL